MSKKSPFGLLVPGKDVRIPLESVGISGEIKGYVASLEATLTYRNGSDDPLEVSFRFPVDEGVAVVGLEAKIAGRTICGVVQEKEEARANYDDAIASGMTAAIGEEKTQDIFSLSLGNLPPKGEAVLILKLVEELPLEGESVRFSLPSVLKPRYTPSGSTDPLAPIPATGGSSGTGGKAMTGTATLSGNILGRPIEHVIGFSVTGGESDNGMPVVHQLAAKGLIRDWEGEGDKKKGDIIKMSTESGVVSSYTAYIAIDEEQDKPIAGAMKTWDLTAVGSSLSVSFKNAHAKPKRFTLSAFGSPKEAAPPLMRSAAKKKYAAASSPRVITEPLQSHVASSDFLLARRLMRSSAIPPSSVTGIDEPLIPLGAIDPLGLMERTRLMKSSTIPPKYDDQYLSSSAVTDSMESLESSNSDDEECIAPAPRMKSAARNSSRSQPGPSRGLSQLISLQAAEGFWILNDSLVSLTGVSLSVLKSACPDGVSVNVWATVLALVLLEKRFNSQRDEWELVAMKAEMWVQAQPLTSTIESLKATASQTVK
uniref:VIT domain-containing protein n=1 Tax=Amphimedon queenslandica TaxID=400682 RepID=A0A1X7TQ34_AMPQE